jgi:hypothetical protein
MLINAPGTLAACRRVGATAPANGFSKEVRGSGSGKLRHETLRQSFMVGAADEKVYPWSPIVVAGDVVVQVQKF